MFSSIKSFFNPTPMTDNESITSIDIVIYAMNLAANAQAIEPFKERLREITAKLEFGQKTFPPRIQSELLTLYLSIEEYLIEKEPLQKFTKASLRKRVEEKLDLTHDNETFWPQLQN